MAAAREDVIEVLKQVFDPELLIDVWTLGLIYDITIIDETVRIRMTFTSIACPVGPQLVEEIKQKLEALPSVSKAEIEVVFQPPWEPSEELKALLGIF